VGLKSTKNTGSRDKDKDKSAYIVAPRKVEHPSTNLNGAPGRGWSPGEAHQGN